MSPSKISVCVVTYNHESYITQCLESVLAQQVDAEVEVLVGVDVSSDGTAELVEVLARMHPDRIRAFVHDERVGAAGNVKFLMAQAKGNFIAHLDGDDAWAPEKLSIQLEQLRRHPEASAAYCNALVVESGPAERPLGKFSDAPTGLVSLECLMRRGNFLNNSSLFFRVEARPFLLALPDEYLDFRSHLTLAQIGPLVYVDKPLVIYRWSTAGSLMNRANRRVRELYWEALSGVAHDAVGSGVRRAAHADFLRRVAFHSLRTLDIGLWSHWWSVVRASTPGPAFRLGLAVAWAIAAEAWRQLRGALFFSSPSRRIFYFHGGR